MKRAGRYVMRKYPESKSKDIGYSPEEEAANENPLILVNQVKTNDITRLLLMQIKDSWAQRGKLSLGFFQSQEKGG